MFSRLRVELEEAAYHLSPLWHRAVPETYLPANPQHQAMVMPHIL